MDEERRKKSDKKWFPIQVCSRNDHAHRCGAPSLVPWSLVEPGRAQAMRNHDQTLELLAKRGGLCPGELRCALEGKKLYPHFDNYSAEQCVADEAWLSGLIVGAS